MTAPMTETESLRGAGTESTTDPEDPAELPVLEFVAPMPGFADFRRFCLVRVGEDDMLYALTAIDDPAVRFLVAPPAPFFPDYAPEIDDESLAALGNPGVEDLLVLVVISTGDTAREATANLMAPIVIAQPTRRLVQLIQGGSGLPTRAPLFGE